MTVSAVGDVGDCTDDPDIARLALDPVVTALVEDFIDATSDLSPPPLLEVSAPLRPDKDALGLSVFALPGIFDLMAPLKEREDSLVSDLLNDGYDCSPSPVERSTEVEEVLEGVFDPSVFFDCC